MKSFILLKILRQNKMKLLFLVGVFILFLFVILYGAATGEE